ncbi:Hypothetical predicted protein [Octopus vulgaris]|uniref:Uncharacterized protein n=1 Tax=Octopus vulgaris TaxID=6645 RepID=A0AA36FAB3_OCTVU|nr:Hypothetical predicted protein [Octopus vulgaris]
MDVLRDKTEKIKKDMKMTESEQRKAVYDLNRSENIYVIDSYCSFRCRHNSLICLEHISIHTKKKYMRKKNEKWMNRQKDCFKYCLQ